MCRGIPPRRWRARRRDSIGRWRWATSKRGLRSGNRDNPFPEEMNRRLITRMAAWHFASTPENVSSLVAEQVPRSQIFLTGNPVVDALLRMAADAKPTPETTELLDRAGGRKIILLTTHRRESFGQKMTGNMAVLREFVGRHPDTVIVFPTHPNPSVRGGRGRHFRPLRPVFSSSRRWITGSSS